MNPQTTLHPRASHLIPWAYLQELYDQIQPKWASLYEA